MAVADATQLREYCLETARRAQAASTELATVNTATKNDWLRRSAVELRKQSEQLQVANARDLEAAPSFGLTPAAVDRLRSRIGGNWPAR